MRIVKLAAVAFTLALGVGSAHAQILVGEESRDFSGADKTKIAERERDAAMAEAKKPKPLKSNRAVPATPDDVTVGSDIRDNKGVVLGRVDAVSMSAAVVVAEGGKVEVPLESFGKNSKGLLLSLTKAEFDAAVAAANKPAN
ncbi:MAG: hypothetical protein KF730_14105 [Sphingomonas sp.]|uniref:hypothetical protein n=1 Tax=Sphingomonas sp. TaxID=28214 RepID=UPI0025F4E4C5|nr:hypothetical protein [Sphingomonas sp.]MBX3565698.1 hypothetical protein [Sphingomonas sp.]